MLRHLSLLADSIFISNLDVNLDLDVGRGSPREDIADVAL